MNEQAKKHVVSAFVIMKFAYGAMTLIAGLDKFFGIIADWVRFISPLVSRFTPIPATSILYIAGTIEIIIGLLILSKHTRLGSYLMAVWFFILAFNYFSFGIFFDIAGRTFVLGMSSLALGCLAEAVTAIKNTKTQQGA